MLPLEAGEDLQKQSKPDVFVDTLTQVWTGDLDSMIKDRLIRVLVVPSRIMYWMDKGKKTGFSYEMMMQFEKEINKRYPPKNKHLRTKVAFFPVSKEKLIPYLLEGRGDIAFADIAITPKRKRKIDFSEPYAFGIDVIAVSGRNAPKIESVVDLSGKKVYVHRSSSYYEYLEKLNFYFSEAALDTIKIKSVPEALTDKEILDLVEAGIIDYTVMDEYKAAVWAKILPNIILHDDIVIKENDKFAWMIRKNSPKLKKEINHFISKHKQGTLVGNLLIKRYVDRFKTEKPEISRKKIEKFEKLSNLFKKYSKKYKLNYLMMMAQAYQESKLDQSAKSRAGAIGIMQLMPSTGQSMKVGNIKNLESNIHAGIKYHRWIIDHYFEEEKIDTVNRTFFAFAAYNAGAGRINGLRKLAKKRGYDPNVWFNNVEVLAAEKIGAETVNYVSNIYEYYVAINLYEQQIREKEELAKKLLGKKNRNEGK